MMVLMQQLDAFLLFLTAAAVLFLLSEDKTFGNFWLRLVLVLFGFFSFSQGMWLIGIWKPGSAGYPWPRVMLDTTIALLAVARVVQVWKLAQNGHRIRHII